MTATAAPRQDIAAPAAALDRERSPLPLAGVGEMVDAAGRALWLDAFRGFVMLCLISRGFGFPRIKSIDWAAPIARQFDHVEWAGMTPWDLVQPFFMFIVGAAMPFAFANRRGAGATWGGDLLRVLRRCGLLLLWAHIAMSVSVGKPILEFINVLAQIAFSYLIAYAVLRAGWRVQVATAVGLLLAYGALFHLWRPPGVTGTWAKEANVGWYLDRLILGKNWSGGYATINFVAASANVIAGVVAGDVVRAAMPLSRKVTILAVSGAALVGLGTALVLTSWAPLVKRLWTPSFALVSTGYSLLALVAFFGLYRAWPRAVWKPFLVVGANSIFLYLASIIFGGRLRDCVLTYTKPLMPGSESEPWRMFVTDWLVLSILVAVAWWMYNRKVFVKL